MKNQYEIVKHTANGDLFYNSEFNVFMAKFGTTFTNKKTASDKMKYACKYASGSDIEGKVEVIKID